MHFNENVGRTTRKTKDGKVYTKVTYPKFKLGEELVREIATSPTYGEYRIHTDNFKIHNNYIDADNT